ncbi:hypothetical protein pipiens_014230 [Culex pipiens pipiens]|uniref:Peptidase S1 domain-containing protein n=1 Tax=Culex pipiens pipiens TaxID=38569 RepID=A0ABD1CVD0_CULPP
MKRFNLSDVTLRLVLAVTLAAVIRPSSGQDFKGAIDQCTKEFDMDMDVVISLKYGDFSERDPLIECFTECLMKRSGFMFDDYSYNKTLIIGFAGRYLEPEGEQNVSQVIIHENYHKKFLFNDIALLILEKPFQASNHIQLLCLAPQGMSFDDERKCIATGWGKERFESPSYQNILKKVELPVMDHENCQNAFRQTRLGANFKVHQTFLCAGGEEGVDTCTGDGGSPLVCPSAENGNRYQLAGIVAWGIGCGQAGVPGAYTKASLFTEWIERNVDVSNDY